MSRFRIISENLARCISSHLPTWPTSFQLRASRCCLHSHVRWFEPKHLHDFQHAVLSATSTNTETIRCVGQASLRNDAHTIYGDAGELLQNIQAQPCRDRRNSASARFGPQLPKFDELCTDSDRIRPVAEFACWNFPTLVSWAFVPEFNQLGGISWHPARHSVVSTCPGEPIDQHHIFCFSCFVPRNTSPPRGFYRVPSHRDSASMADLGGEGPRLIHSVALCRLDDGTQKLERSGGLRRVASETARSPNLPFMAVGGGWGSALMGGRQSVASAECSGFRSPSSIQTPWAAPRRHHGDSETHIAAALEGSAQQGFMISVVQYRSCVRSERVAPVPCVRFPWGAHIMGCNLVLATEAVVFTTQIRLGEDDPCACV